MKRSRGRLAAGRAVALSCAVMSAVVAAAPGDGARGGAPGNDADVLVGQRARHPLTATIGIPEAASRTFAERTVRVSLELGSAFTGGTTSGGEALLLDGETTELAVRWRQPVGRCRAVEARVAMLAHSGGAFDRAIESWHGFFGLPNAGRGEAPENRLLFLHVAPDGTRVSLDESTVGFGDTQLAFAWAPGCGRRLQGDDRTTVLRAGLELPTGDERRWRGNGAVDAWADVQSPVLTLGREWPTRVAASLGIVLPGSGESLPAPVEVAAYGAAGLRTAFGARWSLSASLDWHTRLYDSGLTELGTGAAQFGVGLERRLPGRGRIGVAILEDVLVDTSSDIVLRLTFDAFR